MAKKSADCPARLALQGQMQIGTLSIYYEMEGTGIPVLMLHGNGQSHSIFYPCAGKLLPGHQIILPDSREHGRSHSRSASLGTDFSISDMADDMYLLLRHLRLDRAVLLGFSDGANIALEFAARHPRQTLAVISISGNALPSGLHGPVRLAASGLYAASGLLCRLFRQNSSFLRKRQLSSLLVRSPRLTGKRLSQIQAPVLLIAGTLDLVKAAHTRWMASQLPDCCLHLIPLATHQTFFSHQQVYLSYIFDFLKEHHL